MGCETKPTTSRGTAESDDDDYDDVTFFTNLFDQYINTDYSTFYIFHNGA